MALPTFTMKDLLESGVHFGHHARRWNPKMQPYIFGVRNGVHIIDLQQTLPMLDHAIKALSDIVSKGGKVLFVGTKRQARDKIKETALRCGQYYMNHRWLGGTLTNWNTISGTIARLNDIEKILISDDSKLAYTKKELLMMSKERDKLLLSVGGIREMGGKPDAMIVIDTNQEDIAIKEANKLGIPVFAIVDSNAEPDGVDYIIPGNDDSLRAIELYCSVFADTVLNGLQAELSSAGVDAGVAQQPAAEEAPASEEATQAEESASEEDVKKQASA